MNLPVICRGCGAHMWIKTLIYQYYTKRLHTNYGKMKKKYENIVSMTSRRCCRAHIMSDTIDSRFIQYIKIMDIDDLI
jgi:DNA-directed RNA polymerase subunit N (RpoN/RPB10)